MNEATESNGRIYLNGWFKATLLGFAGFVVLGFTFIGTNVIANDTKYMEFINYNKIEIREIATTLNDMKEDLREIKNILRRTTPFKHDGH